MAAKIKLPGIGEIPRGAAIAGGVAIVGLIVLYSYRQKKAASAAAATTTAATTMVTDPAGNQCVSLDPSSGYCPGTQEDEQYQEQAAMGEGYGGAYSEYPGSAELITDANGNQCVALNPATGLCPATSTTPGTTTATTNAQWVLEAEQQLGDTSTVQAALGYVLSGAPITQAQQQIFQEAVGLIGPPPSGYPPFNITQPATQTAGTVTVPGVVGQTAGAAHTAIVAAGLVPRDPNGAVKGESAWKVGSTVPAGGNTVAKGTQVEINAVKP